MASSSSTSGSALTYADAGVDIDAGNALVERIKPACKATSRSGVMANIGGFGGLFDLKEAGFTDPVLVAATDGVGTKLKLALQTNIHHTVGIDLVAMCVNDLIVQGAEPLFFLDYYACGTLEQDVAAQVIEGIAEGCKLAGCALIGGETAEMPGMYQKDDYDLAGFCVGAAERSHILPQTAVAAGDICIGLPSSGVHSNGFSLVRKLLDLHHLTVNDILPEAAGGDGKHTIGETLLTPTRIYVRACLHALRNSSGIKALAHITGGGLTENLPRVMAPGSYAAINRENWHFPPLFSWLQNLGNISDDEMLKTFNCGIGMVLICTENHAEQVMSVLTEAGEAPMRIGQIQASAEDASAAPYVEYHR